MFTLRAEIAACLIAVAVLGLVSGWMIQRARASRQLNHAIRSWKARYAELEASARQDEQNLEERLQSLVDELKTLKGENRELRDAARGREESSGIVRAEAIEQNRRQAETQERLQRIIRDREREIATLRANAEKREERSGAPAHAPSHGDSRHSPDVATLEQIERTVRSPGRHTAPDPLDETIRLDPAQLPDARVLEAANESIPPGGEPMAGRGLAEADAAHGDTAGGDGPSTIEEIAGGRRSASSADVLGDEDRHLDELLESTIEVAMLDAEEATIALDEESMRLVREFGRGTKS